MCDQDAPGICLALSLHAPNQELRCKIVPTARAWPLPVLMNAVDEFSLTRHARMHPSLLAFAVDVHVCALCSSQPVFVEYVVIGNVNDAPEHAHELGVLLRGRKVVRLRVV